MSLIATCLIIAAIIGVSAIVSYAVAQFIAFAKVEDRNDQE